MTEKGLVQLDSDQLDDESTVEDWLSKQTGVTIGGIDVFIIHQQGLTREDQRYDLLGLDRKGETVTIELKHDRSPRKMVAQALEYASDHHQWKQPYDTLEHRYRDYTGNTESLREAHADYFGLDNPRPKTAFNSDQRIILLAGRFSDRVLSVAEYLRDKGHGIRCVNYNVYSGDGVRMFSTQNVLEQKDSVKSRSKSGGPPDPDSKYRIPTYRRVFDRIQNEVVSELGTDTTDDPSEILLDSWEEMNNMVLTSQHPDISREHIGEDQSQFGFALRIYPTNGNMSMTVERRDDEVAERILKSYRDDIRSDFEYDGDRKYGTVRKRIDIDPIVANINWEITTPQKIADILLADDRVNQQIEEYVEMIHRWHPRMVKEYPKYLEEYLAEE